ncbi:hypothetical protein [Alkalimarinus alittae]|uniref:TonB-dependent receptor plug domain-containing protein n=1 Tax=Alkalimarinus alittae TaxID=2961619 RepID=A0ABY6N3A8_9ALTE|nr:hypothetical protein [Alkalimarinus alittae]UZE96571.1 hypothetical protein NKI27_02130 [Alkalimarinus alittae]
MIINMLMKNKICMVAIMAAACATVPGLSQADESKSIDQLEHKEKSTLQTFHLKEIDAEELSEAVIAGGLEPTSSGGQANQPVTVYEDGTLLEPRDRQTDLGRYEIPVTVNYSEARRVPGVTFGNNYAITPGPGNRVYETFNANVTER